ncbi:hypothetical protein PCASD_23849 [Puccinia coronata f. sp. avenae]|uniref:Uncharacterized protein n=1 Tax=Puccinia coronata f. sp. avenae TaxID=200324 RepID=A0A2N5TN55_9BASI|nr:hypothetical protein PCASD_26845 [Puccinia coronata f. sp. avenae]PLW26930.1 hypothetical protein PCASD_23849 [Puccinia coronata f. sp. avenae]
MKIFPLNPCMFARFQAGAPFIIMDNARVHIGGRMQELCNAQGVLLKVLECPELSTYTQRK